MHYSGWYTYMCDRYILYIYVMIYDILWHYVLYKKIYK